MRATKSIKLKIFILYFILFSTVILSGAYIYKEAKTFTRPEVLMEQEHNKAFLISSTINNLFNAESYSRNAILSNSQKDIQIYYSQLDTVISQIDQLQLQVSDKVIISKLTTVKELVIKKKNSFNQLLIARRAIEEQSNYADAFAEIYDLRQEIEKNIEPIVEQTKNKEKRGALARLFKGDHTDTIKTTVTYPSIADSLINSMQRIVLATQEKIKQQQHVLYTRELQLLEHNKVITDQLNDILLNVEQNIIALSYQKINESKYHISAASTNIAYMGGSALLVIIILGFIIIKDINQNQQYRIALEELNKEKENLLRSKTMLFATVTHDLQTPIGSLVGFTDLLKNSSLDQKQNQYVANIKSCVKYIANLIQDLTDFSRLENNKITISYTNTNLKYLIKSTCEELEMLAVNKNIDLHWDIDPSLDQDFNIDAYRIKQILTNLISNAIKFTQQGSVKVIATKNSQELNIAVKDTGIGIKPEQLDQIFLEFTQAHQGIEKKFGGTGLGLTISKRLIELLDGKIWVESQIDQGSTFYIQLPLFDPVSHHNTSLEYNYAESGFFLDKTILMVDDDKIQLQLLQEIFTPLFKQVILVNDATKVIPILENKNVDILLSDIQMPQLDGFELVQQIRNTPVLRNIPIIALSGKRDLNTNDFTQAGFTDSHNKPLNLNQLLFQIAKLLIPNFATIIERQNKQKDSTLSVITKKDTLYDLTDLQKFIGKEPAALQKILLIFIESTQENLLDLQYAAEENDLDQIARIAHKMLPMFKQINIHGLIDTLQELEDKQIKITNKKELEDYIKNLQSKIIEVLDKLKKDHFKN
ncbi:ATP-binding protein [Myroides sp. LJL119]